MKFLLKLLLLSLAGLSAQAESSDQAGYAYGLELYQNGTLSNSEYQKGMPLLSTDWIRTEATTCTSGFCAVTAAFKESPMEAVREINHLMNQMVEKASVASVVKSVSRTSTAVFRGDPFARCLSWVEDHWVKQGAKKFIWVSKEQFENLCDRSIGKSANVVAGVRAGIKSDAVNIIDLHGYIEAIKPIPVKRENLFDQK